MLELWEAERVIDKMGSGRTGPLLVNCARLTGDGIASQNFVVKAIGLPEITQYYLFNEAIGLRTASRLGVRVPEVALIEISDECIAANREQLDLMAPNLKSGIAVGSTHVAGVAPYVHNQNPSDTEVRDAMWIYASDLVLQNPDRKPSNHNCGQYDGGIIAYDYEQSMSFRRALGGGGDPWRVTSHGICYNHLFFPLLRKMELNWDPFCQRLLALDLDYLMKCIESLPSEWCSQTDKVIDHIVGAVNYVDRLGEELVRSLA